MLTATRWRWNRRSAVRARRGGLCAPNSPAEGGSKEVWQGSRDEDFFHRRLCSHPFCPGSGRPRARHLDQVIRSLLGPRWRMARAWRAAFMWIWKLAVRAPCGLSAIGLPTVTFRRSPDGRRFARASERFRRSRRVEILQQRAADRLQAFRRTFVECVLGRVVERLVLEIDHQETRNAGGG